MPIDLPQQIAYLAPAMSELSKFAPEDLGDDNRAAGEIVESAIRSRILGLDASEAKRAIEEDCDILDAWIKQPGLEDSTGRYVYGTMRGLLMWADFGELAG